MSYLVDAVTYVVLYGYGGGVNLAAIVLKPPD